MLRVLRFYLEWKDQSLTYPIEGIKGQTLPSASCVSCIKGRLEFYAFRVGLVLSKLFGRKLCIILHGQDSYYIAFIWLLLDPHLVYSPLKYRMMYMGSDAPETGL